MEKCYRTVSPRFRPLNLHTIHTCTYIRTAYSSASINIHPPCLVSLLTATRLRYELVQCANVAATVSSQQQPPLYTSGGTPVPRCQMAWIEPEPSSSTQPRGVHQECRAGLGHGHYAGGARRLVRSREHREPFAQPPSAFLGAVEAQALADTDHTAVRELLAPDYGGVSISFAELLFRVVRRCKRDWQVRCRCTQTLSCVYTYIRAYKESSGLLPVRTHIHVYHILVRTS